MEKSLCIHINENSLGKMVGAIYRESLKHIGYSVYTHVHELNRPLIRAIYPNQYGTYVLRVAYFYDNLDEYDRLVFQNEYIEEGRHYPYWWMEYGDTRRLNSRKIALLSKMRESLIQRSLEPYD